MCVSARARARSSFPQLFMCLATKEKHSVPNLIWAVSSPGWSHWGESESNVSVPATRATTPAWITPPNAPDTHTTELLSDDRIDSAPGLFLCYGNTFTGPIEAPPTG